MVDAGLIRSAGAEWEAAEASLLRAGACLHLFARHAWARQTRRPRPWLMTVGPAAAAAGLQRFPSRRAPGCWLMRAERVGSTFSLSEHAAFAAALAAAAMTTSRLARVTAELVVRDTAAADRVRAIWAAAGFRRRATVRSWKRTLVVDLARPEHDVLASFSQKPRRDLRTIARLPVTVRAIDHPQWAPRMRGLLRGTYARTGGTPRPADWPARIAFAAAAPELTRLVGLFRQDVEGESSLIAFAWGLAHGDHATYEIGASARPRDVKIPLLTPLLWDLMRWAQAGGATWFDLGGVSTGTAASGDPFGGISDYKRLFSTNEIDVSDDWEIEPHRVRSRLTHACHWLLGR